jgi:tetratricopeptide (TPR) repeat protein
MRRRLIILCFCLLLSAAAFAQTEEPPAPTAQPEIIAINAAHAVERAELLANNAQTSANAAETAVNQFSDSLQTILTVVGFFVALLALVGGAGVYTANQYIKSQLQQLESVRGQLKDAAADFQRQTEDLVSTRSKWEFARRSLPMIALGDQQYGAGDLNGALIAYQTALETDGENPLIHYKLGYVYTHRGNVELGDMDSAMLHLEHALELNRHYAPALATLGYAHRKKGQQYPDDHALHKEFFKKAEDELGEALARMPKLVDEEGESWHGALGGLHRRTGNRRRAIECYEEACKVTPLSSYPYSNLGLLHLQEGNREEGLRSYWEAERIGMIETRAKLENYWGYADLIVARLALGQKEDAVRDVLDLFIRSAPPAKADVFDLPLKTLRQLSEALKPHDVDKAKLPLIETIIGELGAAQQSRG